jgi:hypothetical protein
MRTGCLPWVLGLILLVILAVVARHALLILPFILAGGYLYWSRGGGGNPDDFEESDEFDEFDEFN